MAPVEAQFFPTGAPAGWRSANRIYEISRPQLVEELDRQSFIRPDHQDVMPEKRSLLYCAGRVTQALVVLGQPVPDVLEARTGSRILHLRLGSGRAPTSTPTP